MRINKPLTEQQIKLGDLIEPGIYPFEIVEAEDTVSRAGNDMLKVKLKVFTPDGRERLVSDYLMEALEYKLAHFFESIGLYSKYAEGAVSAEDCWGRSGEVKIYTQIDKTGQYDPKSSVADYILTAKQQAEKQERKTAQAKAPAKPGVEDGFDTDLPF
jgi:hypothetical protein